MSNNVIKMNDTNYNVRRGLSPAEVLIFNLCDGKRTREDIFGEVVAKIENSADDPHVAFEVCLETLKKRGLIYY